MTAREELIAEIKALREQLRQAEEYTRELCNSPSKDEGRTQAMGDQAWACVAEALPDIERIAEHGLDGSERDAKIVRAVFCAVAGRLCFERGEMAELEGKDGE